jgi:putative transposase
MVSRRLKLKPNRATERELERVMFQLTGLYNWAVRKLYQDARGGRFYTMYDFRDLVNGHGAKCGLNQATMAAVVFRAYRAHHGRPVRSRSARLKSHRNRMGAIPIAQKMRWCDRTHLRVPGLGVLKVRPDPRFPVGRIKYGLISKRPMGWYITLVVDAEPTPFESVGPSVGIDFGFKTLATLSSGEKIANPREYHRMQGRVGQAHRGRNHRLLGRLHQRLANARRVRNHAISRDLLSRHSALYLSRDNYRTMQRTFGKSIHSAAIGQLITMLHAKSRPGGCRVIEVTNRNSTRGCSACGALTGPTGRRQLSVRAWDCGACGASHDRDVNAAVNTLKFGAVLAHEVVREH